jgi:hypothetical protein
MDPLEYRLARFVQDNVHLLQLILAARRGGDMQHQKAVVEQRHIRGTAGRRRYGRRRYGRDTKRGRVFPTHRESIPYTHKEYSQHTHTHPHTHTHTPAHSEQAIDSRVDDPTQGNRQREAHYTSDVLHKQVHDKLSESSLVGGELLTYPGKLHATF